MNLFETLSGIAVRHLKPDRVAALRAGYRGIRTHLAPLMRSFFGSFEAADLRRHLETNLGSDFEILMVHSSLNNLQPMYIGSPLDLLKMLVDFCGPERTLVMPTFYFGDPKYPSTREVFRDSPRFDVRRTPSQMGLLTELFRRYKGAVHSRHPIYRVTALGPLASELTAGHERAGTAAGTGTPFDFMAHHDTLILGLGKPFEVLTQVHHAEDILGEAFPVPASIVEPVSMTLVDGKEEIPFILTARNLSWPRNMWRLRGIMGNSELREWTFHRVPLFATRAALVSSRLVEAARRGITLYERP